MVEARPLRKPGGGMVFPGHGQHIGGDIAQLDIVAQPCQGERELTLAASGIENPQRIGDPVDGLPGQSWNELHHVATQHSEADIALEPVVDIAAETPGEVVEITVYADLTPGRQRPSLPSVPALPITVAEQLRPPA